MKKFQSILLLVVMIMSLMVVSVFATEKTVDPKVEIDIPIPTNEEGDPEASTPTTPAAHVHCICGGCAVGMTDHNGKAVHTCDDTAEWSPISGNVDFGTLASGNYYLEGDVTVSACSSIKKDTKLNICLNGNDISGTKAIFGFTKPGAVISITDCSGEQADDGSWTWDGTITGTNVARSSMVCGGVFYLQSGATANIYGGNITATGTYQHGAIAYMLEEDKVDGYPVYPTFNVYNGYLYNSEGANATSHGGLITSISAASINLYGGKIEGGVSATNGGNIYVASAKDSTGTHRDLIIDGGIVTGGSAKNGGNVYSSGRQYIYAGGLYNGTASNNAGNSFTAWNINLYDGGTISGGKATNGGGNAMATTDSYINIYGGQVLGGEATYGGSLYTFKGVIQVQSNALVSGGKAASNGGNIAVEGKDGKVGTLKITGGTIENGEAKNGGNIALVNADSVGTISKGTITGGKSMNNGGNIHINLGSLTVSGGTIEKGQSTAENGGNINVSGGTFTMTGGTVKDGITKKSAANIYASGAYKIAIKGGTISGGTMKDVNYTGGSIRLIGSTGSFVIGEEGAENGPTISAISQTVRARGGIFFCDEGTVTMHSGTVTGGKVWGSSSKYFGLGGNMYVKNLVMTGGTIQDGVSYAYEDANKNLHGGFGANVYVTGTMTMTGGTISGGTIEGGGSLAIGPNATATITDATITGAKNIQTGGPAAFGNGGNIYVDAGATLTLNNATVSAGTAGKKGGNIYTLGTVIINGGMISGGTATKSLGGSIDIADGASVTVTGATISGGSAPGESGGNFHVAKGAELTLIDSTVTGGSGYSGGNIYCQGGKLTISGGEITDGYARKNGGNINVASGSTFTMDNTTITGGKTKLDRASEINTYGGNIYVAGTLYITDGIEITDGESLAGGNVYAYAVHMDGGTVSGGKAIKHETQSGTGTGGNVYVDGDSTTTISGGTISDGYADVNGGNIHSRNITVSGGTIANGEALKGGGNMQLNGDFTATINGEAVIEGGKSRYGANFYTYGGTLIVEGGIIRNGTATTYGGNIACEHQNDNNPGIFQMSGGVVTGGKVTNLYDGMYQGGGNIWAWDFTMSGGEISNGWSRHNAGNVRAQEIATMTGGEIIDGYAENFGGNMWAGNFNMTGGTISGGYAKQVGGNLCVATLFTAKNVTISDGETATSGGNVWGKYLDWDNVTLTGGKAGNKGGNLFIGEQNATLVDMPRIIKNSQIIDGACTDKSSYGGAVAIKLGTITIENTVITDAADDLAGQGRCIYVEDVGEMILNNVTLTNNSAAGTTIWNEGALKLVGDVTIADTNTLDLMIDARNNADAALEISEYTSTDLIMVRRWEKDSINDDAGIIAKGAVAADLDKFMAWTNGYFVEYIEVTIENEDGTSATEGQIVLSDFAIHAMDAQGGTVAGFTTVEEWMADTQGAWYTLNRDFDGAIINKSMILDLNGHKLTNLILAEGVELTIIDSATDDYDCESGYGTVTLNAANMGTITTGNIKTTAEQIGAVKSYMILVEDGVYSAHRYYVGVTKVTLRTDNKGFGYKATFAGDAKVQEQISRFGFRLWLGDSANVVVRTLDVSKFDSTKEWSLLLKDFDIINLGDVAVNAEVFMTLKEGGEIASSTVSYSMKTMLQKINENLTAFTAEQIQAIQGMFTEEELAVVSQWGIDALLPQVTETPEEEETPAA